MVLPGNKIVVTGGDGFLGRYVQQQLMNRGVDREDILVPLQADYDLINETDVVRMYREMSPDVVIHMAAEVGGIGANRDHPGRFFYANMAMGLHMIEHARRSSVKRFVQIGTICSYPKNTPVPFREEALWEGYPEETNAPYGIAKKALLVMLQAYRQQYGLEGIYLLPVNLYGPGDNFDPASSHVIPAMIQKFEAARIQGEKQVTLWGTGRASREFLYVDDCARGIVAATENYGEQNPVNLGAGFEITISDLAGKIRDLTGFEGEILWDESKPDGQPRRCLDVGLAKEKFGFEAEMDFDEGLRLTIEWFRNHFDENQ